MLVRDEFVDVDVARAERACPANTDDHSSRGFARHLVSDAQEPHQSIQAMMLARVRRGQGGLLLVDVGGDKNRSRHDLENPSTTVDAESRELQRHQSLHPKGNILILLQPNETNEHTSVHKGSY